MGTTLWVLAGIAWWVTGVSGFVFWWTKDYDLTSAQVCLMAALGLIGPMTWVIGWSVHGDHAVVMRRRK